MNIAHVITTLSVGGAQTVLYDLLAYWKVHNPDITHHVIYMRGGPNVARIQALGIPVHHVTYPHQLAKHIKRIKPDVIHSSLWKANFISRFIARYYNIPLVSSLHNDYKLNGKLRNTLDALTLGVKKQTFIGVAQGVKQSFDAVYGDSMHTVVIENGVDVQQIRTRAKPIARAELGDAFVIGAVGRLEPVKRYDILIKACGILARQGLRLSLVVVGDGSQRDRLKVLAEREGVSALFVGEQEDPCRFYPLFDCYAISSQTEGLSMALLEAMAFGLPIITTCEQRMHDVIKDGVHGLLVPIGDECAFADGLKRLYDDHGLRNRMKRENSAIIEGTFHISNVAKRYTELYAELRAG